MDEQLLNIIINYIKMIYKPMDIMRIKLIRANIVSVMIN